MILRNKNNNERNVELLLKIEKDKNNFYIYKDSVTGNIYISKKIKNKLVGLTEEELSNIEKIYQKIDG